MSKGTKSGTKSAKQVRVRGYGSHVFVCSGGDCKKRGSKGVRKAIKDEIKDSGMRGEIRLDSVGCLGLCKHGPNAIVYPEGTWYVGLTEEDVPEVVEEHLAGGRPVERLAAEFR